MKKTQPIPAFEIATWENKTKDELIESHNAFSAIVTGIREENRWYKITAPAQFNDETMINKYADIFSMNRQKTIYYEQRLELIENLLGIVANAENLVVSANKFLIPYGTELEFYNSLPISKLKSVYLEFSNILSGINAMLNYYAKATITNDKGQNAQKSVADIIAVLNGFSGIMDKIKAV